nr:hypothetical protein [uncultured Enterococcus sp.]
MDPNLIQLAATLTELTAKNTVSFVGTKMKEAKTKKTIDEQSLAYSEIINGLLEDKLELERVANQYKEMYEKVTISDDDITYLQNTLEQAVVLLMKFTPNLEESKQSIDMLIKLLNKDTLKTMQLLGFNYKEAIGVPLTEACANAISNKFNNSKNNNRNSQKRNK